MKNIVEKLKKLGLEEKEAKVYLASLELGPATVREVAKKSKLQRTTIYDVLITLKEKRLISQVKKNKKTLIYPSGPVVLELDLLEKNKTFEEILPQLKKISKETSSRPHITFHDSQNEIERAYLNTIKNTKIGETLGIYSGQVADSLGSNFLDEYVKVRVKKSIKTKAIAINDSNYEERKEKNQSALRESMEFKIQNEFPINVEVINNSVFITKLKGNAVSVQIHDEDIARAFRELFYLIWSKDRL